MMRGPTTERRIIVPLPWPHQHQALWVARVSRKQARQLPFLIPGLWYAGPFISTVGRAARDPHRSAAPFEEYDQSVDGPFPCPGSAVGAIYERFHLQRHVPLVPRATVSVTPGTALLPVRPGPGIVVRVYQRASGLRVADVRMARDDEVQAVPATALRLEEWPDGAGCMADGCPNCGTLESMMLLDAFYCAGCEALVWAPLDVAVQLAATAVPVPSSITLPEEEPTV